FPFSTVLSRFVILFEKQHLFALKKAQEFSTTAAIVTYQSKLPHLEKVKDLLTVPPKELIFAHPESIGPILDALKSEGINTVIGGSLVLEAARQKDMRGIFIYSMDGVERALDMAVQIAFSKHLETEKAEQLRTILDFAYGGIIATDKSGTVTVFNPSAEKITGISRHTIIGQNIEQFLPTTRLTQVMKTGQSELNKLQAIGEVHILTNRIPIIVKSDITGAVATFQDIGSIQEAEEQIRKRLYEKGFLAKAHLTDILGNSESLLQVKRQAALYAPNSSTVLILGESGTGKELFAQAIHNASSRSPRPFVAINCAALPENLLESELFGYADGAFTGAKKGGKPGLFELAHAGTIFLDEIGEISMSIQARLLRVLEEHEVMRIGGDRIIPVDIRVIAATNKHLWQMVEHGVFREDLYYRLNILTLVLPSLRMRRTDMALLVHKFLSELRPDLTDNEIKRISEQPGFQDYDWPGNVRELKNFVERFSVLLTPGTDAHSLFESLLVMVQSERILSDDDEEEIENVLRSVQGNKTEAAKRLGISRTTLWRRMRGKTH
ncbi:MAG: sigma 54-interacting transcriptional regulator, partial [Desulfitobacteriaceae bacterium]|nr:sigma 54-interacting transcriptional regulator [Desulfitobacteriaceae bacterium]MDI6878861.1 sigma 54-interacting transcriptional regulator [Desulfitobacteriaceae bacterium]MDI6914586.1 sigma 54-interacting transcriptional regulator [Desulfitobacteriaceae bacterium]